MSIIIRNNFRNPKNSWIVNPLCNWEIDPKRNWQIDPKRNWQIDPKRNWEIDPKRNWQIDPVRNWQVNPARNWQINSVRNWQVNPARNYTINPNNVNFKGLYVVKKSSLECDYYLVKTVLSNVLLGYDEGNNYTYLLIGVNNVYSIYDNEIKYIGYLCPNSKGGYNWFDINGNWVYFLV